MPRSAPLVVFRSRSLQTFVIGLAVGIACLGLARGWGEKSEAADRVPSAQAPSGQAPSKQAGGGQKDAQDDAKLSAEMADARRALGPLQSFVGAWKGAGQVKRGSTDGAWSEEADWSWDYSGDKVAVVYHAPASKVHTTGRITVGDAEDTFKLTATPAGDSPAETFTGKFDDEERVTFVADEMKDGRPAEIVMRLVAKGRRMVMIYQRQSAATGGKSFMAEVGFSRKGSNFGRDDDLPECVLTGGEASIAVTHEGKTYYVCCTGCRDYFVENPDKVIAEYHARLAKRKMKQP